MTWPVRARACVSSDLRRDPAAQQPSARALRRCTVPLSRRARYKLELRCRKRSLLRGPRRCPRACRGRRWRTRLSTGRRCTRYGGRNPRHRCTAITTGAASRARTTRRRSGTRAWRSRRRGERLLPPALACAAWTRTTHPAARAALCRLLTRTPPRTCYVANTVRRRHALLCPMRIPTSPRTTSAQAPRTARRCCAGSCAARTSGAMPPRAKTPP